MEKKKRELDIVRLSNDPWHLIRIPDSSYRKFHRAVRSFVS